MFSTLALVVFVAVLVMAFNKKLRRRVKGWFTRETNNLADNFGDVVTDMHDSIQTGKIEAAKFKGRIAELIATNKMLEKDQFEAVHEAEKWGAIAKEAAAKNNEEHVRLAVTNRQKAEQKSVKLSKTVEDNETLISKLCLQLDTRVNELKNAESDVSTQNARLTSLRMRERMSKASNSFGGEFDDFSKAKKELDMYEAKLDAEDSLSSNDSLNLEKIYNVDTSVEDEVAKLLKKETNVNVK